MDTEYLILRRGEAGYAEFARALDRDPALRAWAYANADTTFPAGDEKVWCVAMRFGRVMATRAIEPADEPGYDAKITDNVERPMSWDHDRYGIVFEMVEVLTSGLNVVSYVFADPMDLHEAAGYRVEAGAGRPGTGRWGAPARGLDEHGHEWFRVVRDAR